MSNKIKRALISVSNKTNLHKLAPFLIEQDVQIISTGGTRKYLTQHGVPSTELSKYTGFPEMMDGRLKTLHPRIHGGILGRREEDSDIMYEHNILPIDLVIVNLYDFESTVSKSQNDLDGAIEQIDIGGPAMLRSAAKNYKHVIPLINPDDYDKFMNLWVVNNGEFDEHQRLAYAQKVFNHTSKYDDVIAQYLFMKLVK